MGKVITFGVQKGGSGKTTSAGICAWLLSQDKKILAVDLDSQGNLTELLTQQDIYDFTGRTILEAMKERFAKPYIHRITDNLHIITAEDLLATFPRWVYRQYERQNPTSNPSLILKETLASIREDYDYIIIDTPPALGDQTINALAASDAVVAVFESSKFCYSALERFIETIVHVQNQLNPDLKIAGILRGIIDNRRLDNKAIIDLIKQEYEGLAFETVIQRKAATGRLAINGFFGNSEIKQAVEPYHGFLKELVDRVR